MWKSTDLQKEEVEHDDSIARREFFGHAAVHFIGPANQNIRAGEAFSLVELRRDAYNRILELIIKTSRLFVHSFLHSFTHSLFFFYEFSCICILEYYRQLSLLCPYSNPRATIVLI